MIKNRTVCVFLAVSSFLLCICNTTENPTDPVVDTEKPVITFEGGDTVILRKGDPDQILQRAKVTASDDICGDLTDSIVMPVIFISKCGIYNVVYRVSDFSGNTATNSRVIIVDCEAPVISILGENPMKLNVGSTYNEMGATAIDDIDGTVAISKICISGSVNTKTLHTDTITYSVKDRAGNEANEKRQVKVIEPPDTIASIIIFNGGIGKGDTVIVKRGDPDAVLTTTARVTAVDTGAIRSEPDKITLTNSGYFASQCSVYVVIFTATDEAGNSSTKTRTIIVDCDPPIITLAGSNPISLLVGGTYIEPGASATDNIDGPVAITTTGTVKTTTEHIDTIIYSARDRAGNVSTKKRLVIISQAPDTEPPELALLGNNPLSILEGTPYSEPGWTAMDNHDGNLHDSVKVTGGPIVTTIAGRDTLTYTVSDKAGNTAVVKRIIVIKPIGPVIDTIPPDLRLIGPGSIEIPVGGAYVEPGWVAFDNVDGDIRDSVKIIELFGKPLPIVTSVPTTYNIVYSVTDRAGNRASVLREVKIVGNSIDTVKPVISLEGKVKDTVKLGSSYVDLGATATDNVDGVITSSIQRVIKNAVGAVASLTPATAIGDYMITYTVSDKAGNAAIPKVRNVYCKDTFVDANDLLNKYGVPLPSALPTVSGIYKTSVTTDGDKAPNVSNINNFQLDWNGTQLLQFRLGTSDGIPDYTVDLTGPVRANNTFGSANPGFTLTGAFTELNGEYYIKADATQCVWVQKEGNYAIIFTK